jgi:hypothetical protein
MIFYFNTPEEPDRRDYRLELPRHNEKDARESHESPSMRKSFF